MEPDALATLGLRLRAEADEWLGELLGPWTLPGAEAAAEPLAELALLESAVASLAGQVAELERLESSLTAGFPGAPAPAVPADGADAAADEPGADARTARRGRDGGAPRVGLAPPATSQSGERAYDATGARVDRPRVTAVSRGSGEAGRGDEDRSPAPVPMARRRLDVPFSAPADDRDAADGGSAAPDAASPRAARGWDAVPSSGGGIGGLGDLAALAGSRGLDLPPVAEQPNDGPRWDLPRSADGVERSGGADEWEDAARPGRESIWGDAPGPSPSAPSDALTRQDQAGHAALSSTGTAATPIRQWTPDRQAEDESRSGGLAADADRSSSPEASRGWDQEQDGGAARAERRWTGLPASITRLATDGGLTFGVPESVTLPFLSMPGEPETSADAAGKALTERDEATRPGGVSIDRRPGGFPAPRSSSSASPAAWTGMSGATGRGGAGVGADATTGAMKSLAALGEFAEEIGRAASLAGFDGAAADAGEAAVGDVARAVGRRVRTAAEILGALGESELTVDSAPQLQGSTEWPTLAPEPVERAAPEPGAAPDPQPRAVADEPPVAIVRSVEAPPRDAFPEPLSLHDVDVQDLMDALAREIMHEYRRHYGA